MIKSKDCDIICLQEVDSSDSFFEYLSGLGYEYRFRAKGLQGILIAFKRNVFQLIDSKVVNFDTLINSNVDKALYRKGHGSIMVKVRSASIQLETKDRHRIVVANTHLYWDPQFEKVKYHQICSAMIEAYSFSEATDSVILTGDLNSLPESNVVRFVQYNEHPIRELCVKEDDNFPEMVEKYYQVRSYSMQLANVFSDEDGKYTNYTRDFKGKIDYVFYDFTKLQVVEKERLPDEAELAKEVALPNSQFPSDHVPLICTFMLNGKHKVN